MHKLILIVGLAINLNAFADNHDGKPHANFEQHKTQMLQSIDKRISALQDHKTCVAEAADKEALKKCHESMKEFRSDMKEEREERKKEYKSKREEKRKQREERKAQRQKNNESSTPSTTESDK